MTLVTPAPPHVAALLLGCYAVVLLVQPSVPVYTAYHPTSPDDSPDDGVGLRQSSYGLLQVVDIVGNQQGRRLSNRPSSPL